MEMLFPRSKVVTTAKAFGLQAIDIVSTVLIGDLGSGMTGWFRSA